MKRREAIGLAAIFVVATTSFQVNGFLPQAATFAPAQRTSSASTLFTYNSESADNRRRRKRDILRKKLSFRRQTSRLSSGKGDDDESQSKQEQNTQLEFFSKFKVLQNLRTESNGLMEKVPEPLLTFFRNFMEKISSWKGIFVSFTAGAFIATAAIIYPIYTSVENLSKPVTLFETILGDLEMAYVEPIDTNKLFETGVSAMLRSLDPYTEFEGAEEAVSMNESIEGKYGGVGLVISGSTKSAASSAGSLLPDAAIEDKEGSDMDKDLDSEYRRKGEKAIEKAKQNGIRVVTAFEGYAFDYGMRVGDKLVSIDDTDVTQETTVEDVRNLLRGEPGTSVSISFERDGVSGIQTVTMPRSVVRLRDVKLATLVGDPKDGIGYIQLSGFTANAGPEMRQAISYLQKRSEAATNGDRSLQGLVLDLRGNPGGLLTSAVDVASLLVPKGSDIVSAKGRGFPGMLYRSRAEPLLESSTKLAVLVNGQTASAAEIVAGAIQDLDVGVIVGADRSFGKGLVQNVEELPFNTALKFTVAKYYTPSGRCIQGVKYSEGGGLNAEDGNYIANKVTDAEKQEFFTKSGRVVRDGGGIEADYKVKAPKASALEVTLIRSGVIGEFAADWCKNHRLTNTFEVTEDIYRNFQAFVDKKQKTGDLDLEALYSGPIDELKKTLKQSGYKGAERELNNLQASIVRDLQSDFSKYRKDIKEDIAQSILARYIPESMLIERGIKSDVQVNAALKLVENGNDFKKILAKGNAAEKGDAVNLASKLGEDDNNRARASIKW